QTGTGADPSGPLVVGVSVRTELSLQPFAVRLQVVDAEVDRVLPYPSVPVASLGWGQHLPWQGLRWLPLDHLTIPRASGRPRRLGHPLWAEQLQHPPVAQHPLLVLLPPGTISSPHLAWKAAGTWLTRRRIDHTLLPLTRLGDGEQRRSRTLRYRMAGPEQHRAQTPGELQPRGRR